MRSIVFLVLLLSAGGVGTSRAEALTTVVESSADTGGMTVSAGGVVTGDASASVEVVTEMSGAEGVSRTTITTERDGVRESTTTTRFLRGGERHTITASSSPDAAVFVQKRPSRATTSVTSSSTSVATNSMSREVPAPAAHSIVQRIVDLLRRIAVFWRF